MDTITGKITWFLITAFSVFFVLKFLFPALGLVLGLATAVFNFVGRSFPR